MSSLSVRAAALAATCALACGDDGGGPGPDARPDGFDRAAMLRHLADHVFLPMHEAAAARAAALPGALDTYCTALGAGDATAELAAARAAWGEAIDAWQAVDAALVGPAAMEMKAPRDRVYAWPLLSTCGIDRDVVAYDADPAAYDPATRLNNVRSLTAIEYLLFSTSTAHTCPTVPAGWDALAPRLPRARCHLALALAGDVAATTASLAQAWRPAGGDYAGVLAGAGTSGSSIATAQAGVNLVSDSLFYLDRMVKDMKLGEASGIQVNACGTVQAPCDREIELRFADRSMAAMRINLRAFREVFTGTTATADGPAFDDFLRAVGATALADQMVADTDAMIALADAMPESFRTTLTGDYARVVELYEASRLVTNELKSQFLTVLALDIPDDVATDND